MLRAFGAGCTSVTLSLEEGKQQAKRRFPAGMKTKEVTVLEEARQE